MNCTLTISAETPAELFSIIKVDAKPATTAPNTPVPIQNPMTAPAAVPVNTVPQVGMPVTPRQAPNPIPPTGQMPPVAYPMPLASAPAPAATNPVPTPIPQAPIPIPAVPLSAPPTYTIDDLSKVGGELAQAGKMDDLCTLLHQFGVEAITQLQPNQIGQFAVALRGLGAAL